MDLGAALVQGGLLSRDVDAYNQQQAERGFRMRQIQSGIQRMDDEEASRPQRLQTEQLRRDIERAELEYKQRSQPTEQANADKQRVLAGANLDTQAALQPGQVQIAKAQQQEQLRTVKEQQLARMWNLYRTGDKATFLDVLNNSSVVAPGRKFKDVEQAEVPGAGGAPVRGIKFVPDDGQQPIFIPDAQMEALSNKHAEVIKLGNALVQRDPMTGKPSVLYDPEQSKFDLALKKLDHEYSLRTALEEVKRRYGQSQSTALQKNIEYLVSTGIAKTQAEAYDKLRTTMSRSEEDAIQALIPGLVRDGITSPEKAVEKATTIVRQIRGGATPATAFKSAEDVRAAFRAGKIDRARALQELNQFAPAK